MIYILKSILFTGWSVPATTLFYTMALTLHGLVWNTIHPPMHGLPDVPLSIGTHENIYLLFLIHFRYMHSRVMCIFVNI
jgi:hypothetical protein